MYNIGAPAFSINSQNVAFRLQAQAPKSVNIQYMGFSLHKYFRMTNKAAEANILQGDFASI